MLGLAAVPSVLMFAGMLFMPESPRWLVFKGCPEQARLVLSKLRPADKVDAELQSIVKDFKQHRRSQLGECSTAVFGNLENHQKRKPFAVADFDHF